MGLILKVNIKPNGNREKKLDAKHGKGWCNHCDMTFGSVYEKCFVCGNIRGERKKNKKPYPLICEDDFEN